MRLNYLEICSLTFILCTQADHVTYLFMVLSYDILSEQQVEKVNKDRFAWRCSPVIRANMPCFASFRRSLPNKKETLSKVKGKFYGLWCDDHVI